VSRPDLIVVGGGIIGLSAAFLAARGGLQVVVVDARQPATTGATAVAAGMLAPLAEAHDMPDDLVRHGIESARRYPSFIDSVQELGGPTGFNPKGTLLVAAYRDQAGDLEQLGRSHQRLGLQVERLSVRQVLRREPRISPRIAGGLWCPEDHAVPPVQLGRALVRAIEALGGQVRVGAVAQAIDPEGEGIGVRVHHGGQEQTWRAPRVLVAAGLGSQQVLGDVVELALRPVKGQVLHLRGEALLGGVVRTPRVYLVPFQDRLVVGASEEEMGEHAEPLAGVTMDLLYEAWRTLPGVYDLELERILVGHRPSTRNGRPVIGPLGPEGLFVACGHHRHGILLAPWTADVLADMWGLTPAR